MTNSKERRNGRTTQKRRRASKVQKERREEQTEKKEKSTAALSSSSSKQDANRFQKVAAVPFWFGRRKTSKRFTLTLLSFSFAFSMISIFFPLQIAKVLLHSWPDSHRLLSVNAKAPKTLQSSQHLQKKATKTVRRSFEKEVGSGEVFADVGPASWKAALAGASGGETSWRGPPVGRKAAGGAPRSRRSAARLCTRTKGAA